MGIRVPAELGGGVAKNFRLGFKLYMYFQAYDSFILGQDINLPIQSSVVGCGNLYISLEFSPVGNISRPFNQGHSVSVVGRVLTRQWSAKADPTGGVSIFR